MKLNFIDIQAANNRIKNKVINTKLLTSNILNNHLKAQIFFKCDNFQVTNSFKARGAFNAILAYLEKHGYFPQKIVAVSSGNHAQAVAYVCKSLNIPCIIYMAGIVSPYKIKATQALGAEVILCEKRKDANAWAAQKVDQGYFFIHPSANDDVIAGQGTACLEALNEIGEVEAIFAPIGGGGLVSGTYLAAQGLSKNAKVFACEPLNANDAARSVREGKIVGYEDSPNTIADGARTLSVLEPCFSYLKKIAGFYEISEKDIVFWQKEFLSATSILIEPTSALAIAGAAQYLKEYPNSNDRKILVIISGGNLEKII